jgi:hypothetical protein
VTVCRVMPPRRPLKVDKLSDEFGHYDLFIKCACGHMRQTNPQTLAKFLGWDIKLADLAKRLRCSKCGKKNCTVIPIEVRAPRGYGSTRRTCNRSPPM